MIRSILHTAFLLLMLFLIGAAETRGQVGLARRQADKLFESGDHYHAMQSYKDLLNSDPNDPELNYNVGNSLYRLQQYDQAKLYYEKALAHTSDAALKNKIQYNLSNCEFKSKKLKESIEGYKQVLRKDPNDEDARKNLELALKEMQKQNPPPQKNENKDRNKKDQNKEQKDEKQEEKQKQEPDQDAEKDQKKQNVPRQGMDKKQAERILDALKNQEKEYQKKKVKEKVTKDQKTDKDW